MAHTTSTSPAVGQRVAVALVVGFDGTTTVVAATVDRVDGGAVFVTSEAVEAFGAKAPYVGPVEPSAIVAVAQYAPTADCSSCPLCDPIAAYIEAEVEANDYAGDVPGSW